MEKESGPIISIIVPALNEAGLVSSFLKRIFGQLSGQIRVEVLLVDGGSQDNTVALARKAGARVLASETGRAAQMNTGAQRARGSILYFLHIDSLPPKNFDLLIHRAVAQGYHAGCFRMRFDVPDPVLRFFAWFTRFNFPICRGGDQSLFITKQFFIQMNGFNPAYRIYEDNEFTNRLYRHTAFKVLPSILVTSARKYATMGVWRLQYHYFRIHLKKAFGGGPDELYRYYRKNVLGGLKAR